MSFWKRPEACFTGCFGLTYYSYPLATSAEERGSCCMADIDYATTVWKLLSSLR